MLAIAGAGGRADEEACRMTHPLVKQLRFTRREFARALRTVEPEEAVKRVLPLNSLGWSIGHMAWQE